MTPVKLVVVGASAGAFEALTALLSELPADYPLPLLIVVHLPPDRNSVMVELLQAHSRLKIVEAEDKQPIEPGTAYLAPPDYHLQVEKHGCLSLSADEPVLYSRPSVDVLFETAADAFAPELLGVVLTGANRDGAAGLKMIMDAGGKGLVQDPATATASEMPRAALELCPRARKLRLEEIAAYLRALPTI